MTAQARSKIRKHGDNETITFNRRGRRIASSLDVALYRSSETGAADTGLVGVFCTRDLDSRGMFLETGKIELQPYEVVHLHITISVIDQIKKYWLRGIVVRHNDSGLGIRYSDIQSNAFFHDLRMMLQH